jgi:SAM-dependent methyltransferase
MNAASLHSAPPVAPSPVVWEKISCPLCRQSDEELLLTVPADPANTPYRLVRCRRCGMGYVNPRPTPSCINLFYPPDYKPYQPRTIREGWFSRLRFRLEQLVLARSHGYPPPLTGWFQKILAALAAPFFGPGSDSLTALPYVGDGKLLDFGCGSGWLAYRLRERGWDVVGMDFSEHAARQTREAYGIPVLVGSLPDPRLPPASLDAIVMGGVLEHVHWPHPLIEQAARALKPGGLLAISVPNLDSWAFRTFGRNWFSLDVPRHLLHFTPETLRQLVEAHGLEVAEMRFLRRCSWMQRSLQAMSRQRSGFALAGRWLSGLIASWTVWSKQADCLLLLARRKASPAIGYQYPA